LSCADNDLSFVGGRAEVIKRSADINVSECKLRINYWLETAGFEEFAKAGQVAIGL
jgi:hypothetical protein